MIADLGYSLAEQGRSLEAITIFEGLAALAPATSYFQSALGALWLRTGQPKRAIAHLDAALAADSDDVAAMVNRGEAYLQLGDQTTGARDLHAALKRSETLPPIDAIYVTRTRALLKQIKRLGEANS